MDQPLFVLTAQNGFSFSTSVVEGFSSTKSANYAQTSIMNRSSPIITYSNSAAIIVSVTLKLVALDAQNFKASDVAQIVQGFRSLCFPVNPGIEGPPLCYLSFGNKAEFNNWSCVCQSVNPHPTELPMYDTDGSPFTTTINVSFLGIEFANVSTTDWGQGSLKSWKQLAF